MVTKRTQPKIIASSNEDGPLNKKFEELVIDTLELWHVPGVSVAVVDGEETYAQVSSLQSKFPTLISLHQGYGIASIPDTPNYPHLRRQHHQSIHRGCDVAFSRGQRKLSTHPMGHANPSVASR